MDPKTIAAVERTVDDLQDELFGLAQELVRIPSVVGQEGPAQEFIAQRYAEVGLEVELFEASKSAVENHESFIDSKIPFAGRPNVIARRAGDPGKRSLILCGHIDVVSPEPVAQWKHDPWSGFIENGRLHGRGSLDMKGGLAANLIALKALGKTSLRSLGPVMLQSVIEEEAGGGGGTLACLTAGHTADAMFFTEPVPAICIAHAGVLYFKVRVEGVTAHAGRAHEGVNAIQKMMKVLDALFALDEHRRATVSYPLFQPNATPACHLNLGSLTAGDWPSTVAGFAELEGRISFVPGETKDGIKSLVENAVREAAQADPWLREHPPEIEWFGWQSDPWQQDPEHPFVLAVADSVKEVTGGEAKMIGKPAGLDTRFAAFFNMPAISFGPAGEFLHGCNEYVDLDSLVMVTKVVALTVLSWCSRAKD